MPQRKDEVVLYKPGERNQVALYRGEKRQKKKRKALVLEEDRYVDALDSIIRRDYFPALEPLERVFTGQGSRNTPSARSRRYGSSVRSTFEDDTPVPRHERQNRENKRSEEGASQASTVPKKPEDLRLDQFTQVFTSEDNASFVEIQEKEAIIKAQKVFWLEENRKQAEKIKLLTDSSNSDYDPKTSGLLETWGYEVKNTLMFHPSSDHHPHLEERKAQMVAAPKKEIIKENTRFPGGFFDKPTMAEERKLEDAGGTPMIGGYRLMRTPSPAPGRGGGGRGDTGGGNTPFITWGDIAGTPLHLREEDDDPDEDEDEDDSDDEEAAERRRRRKEKKRLEQQQNKKGFRVPATPSRDELAWRLDAKVQRKRQKPVTPGSRVRSASAGRSPATPGSPMLSPAAMRLLKSGKLGSNSKVDSQLRAQYTPSPKTHRQRKETPSPLIGKSPSTTPRRDVVLTPSSASLAAASFMNSFSK